MTSDASAPTESKTQPAPFRILSLDGGGAKGFYTLGVLREIEAMIERPLCQGFDLVFGTSTGAIIAALIALGYSVDEIHTLYKVHVVSIMKQTSRAAKTKALAELGWQVFADASFDDVKTRVGLVATNWGNERPMIFKGSVEQAHGRASSFVPGFGVPVRDAVQASCSAYPFFERTVVETSTGDRVELVDGGYCANNPTLYAIADATQALGCALEDLRIVSVGVGVYPEPKRPILSKMRWAKYAPSVQLLQKTLEINTQSMDQLRHILYGRAPTIRISNEYNKPEMATDLFEHDLAKLNMLRQRGAESFAAEEPKLRTMLVG